MYTTMSQFYSSPERENDPHALPDMEVFYQSQMEAIYGPKILFPKAIADKYTSAKAGWYWWSCFPGCLPDSEPMGPFETEAEAIADATES
jgi:hypothetical protein